MSLKMCNAALTLAKSGKSGNVPKFMPDLSPRSLVVLGCSATKFDVGGHVPAVHLYDGPMYRVLRSHLRSYRWPSDLSLGVLSAKYGLIGGLAPIQNYEQRMTARRAGELKETVTATLREMSAKHKRVHAVLGRDYLQAIDASTLANEVRIEVAEGPIGMKLHQFSQLLNQHDCQPRISRRPERGYRPLYFLPDWDDFLDVDYDFRNDIFSTKSRAERNEVHMIKLFQPQRLCDGVLVSLAQHLGTKGLLRRVPLADSHLLKPRSVRDHFGLSSDQWAFGDCGAFSYANEDAPTISVEQAVAVYELYEFDMGASVDHIPLKEIVTSNRKRILSDYERKKRVKITCDNADEFLSLWRARGCSFTPVGAVQGLDARSCARHVREYMEMGYEHIALGGLVPRTDEEITDIVKAVAATLTDAKRRPWIHLLGIFRPNLQKLFRQCGINSFDSATYFRKAWLRSDQNYLGVDAKWYGAIRVPPTRDARTLLRLKEAGTREATIKKREREAMKALLGYENRRVSLKKCLKAILRYDGLLNRAEPRTDLAQQYKRTLESRPWERCKCTVCKSIGINAVIFRGYNRNKRRGAHNTLGLYNRIITM